MGIAEQIGHDHKGNSIYQFEEKAKALNKEVWDDTKEIRKELTNKSQKYIFSVQSKTLKDYLVPRYYWNTKIEEAEKPKFRQKKEICILFP